MYGVLCYCSMNNIWLLTSDMIKRISDRVKVETTDNLYYTICLNTDKSTIICTVEKTYDNHVEVVKYQFRNSARLFTYK